VLARTNLPSEDEKLSGYSQFKVRKDWFEGLKRRHPGIVVQKLGTATKWENKTNINQLNCSRQE